MMKVEAVVVRDRIETVMDAVEEQTGHVGVTVIEAVGHGRQRGITHEYRGRVFESRFLPKALLTFVVADALVEPVSSTRSSTRRGPATTSGDGICLGDARRQRHAQPDGQRAWRRWRSDDAPRSWPSPRPRSGSSSPRSS